MAVYFCHGRIISNRMISKAIDHAYQSQIPKAGFPFAVLNISVDAAVLTLTFIRRKVKLNSAMRV